MSKNLHLMVDKKKEYLNAKGGDAQLNIHITQNLKPVA